MNETSRQWAQATLSNLRNTTQHYSQREKESLRIAYVENAFVTVPALCKTEEQEADFRAQTDLLISFLPLLTPSNKVSTDAYMRQLLQYKYYLKRKFRLLTKGQYRSTWFAIGLAIGVSYGVLWKNLALGISLGLAVGLLVGNYLDGKAAREQRQL